MKSSSDSILLWMSFLSSLTDWNHLRSGCPEFTKQKGLQLQQNPWCLITSLHSLLWLSLHPSCSVFLLLFFHCRLLTLSEAWCVWNDALDLYASNIYIFWYKDSKSYLKKHTLYNLLGFSLFSKSVSCLKLRNWVVNPWAGLIKLKEHICLTFTLISAADTWQILYIWEPSLAVFVCCEPM